MTLIDLANPTRIPDADARVLPWLAGLTAFLFMCLYQSAAAPDDYQQAPPSRSCSSTCRRVAVDVRLADDERGFARTLYWRIRSPTSPQGRRPDRAASPSCAGDGSCGRPMWAPIGVDARLTSC